LREGFQAFQRDNHQIARGVRKSIGV
jgi:hypothetical protein